jgi:hypothetical protein
VKFYVQKFIGRFGDEILQDMIHGIKNKKITSKISVSHDAEEALNAFNEFFKENIDDVVVAIGSSKEEQSYSLAA